jgi:CDP-diacylglycerol--serine O-phosphatidyltransferase
MDLDLKKSLFVLPNLFTLSSLGCGFYAIVACMGLPGEDDFYRAALVIICGMFLDAVDGRVARMTRTQSAFGTQLDSLADVVTFGVAPAVLMYRWTLWEWALPWGLLAAIVYVAAGAVRLARFNVIAEREAAQGRAAKPGKYILGMPIPTAAGVLVSLVVFNRSIGGYLREATAAFGILCFVLAILMVAPVRFRSFKDLRPNVPTLLAMGTLLVTSIVVAVYVRPSVVLVCLLGGYVALGLAEAAIGVSRRLGQRVRQTDPGSS